RAPSDAQAREDDAELLRMAAFGATLGLNDEIMLRLLRAASENLRRVVDFELELFRVAIEQPLLQEGMTERQMLDQMAALRGLVQEALASGGRPVSIMADVVLLHFADPYDGVRGALALVERIAKAGLPPARVGMHAGPVVVRDGEFFGRTVNTARRIGEYARP